MDDLVEQFNKFMEHPLHSHPHLEERLGVSDEHVVVDRLAWTTYMVKEFTRPDIEVNWWTTSMN